MRGQVRETFESPTVPAAIPAGITNFSTVVLYFSCVEIVSWCDVVFQLCGDGELA